MSRKREGEPEKDVGDRWLLTYSDLITLLMIFFVVLYSISKVDANKFQAIAESLNRALGGGTPARMEISNTISGPQMLATGNPTTDSSSAGPKNQEEVPSGNGTNKNQGQGNADQENMTIEGIKAKLDKFAKDNNIQTTLVSSVEERGLVVSIHDTLLFDSGKADITPRAHQILGMVGSVLAATPNYIKVEGHTDNVPISTSQFPSNWELSVIRATNVVQLLISEGHILAERLSATGYGEYRPVAVNGNDEGRARNRRVDLVILRSKYDLTEPSNVVAPNLSSSLSTGVNTSSSGN